MVIGVLVSVCSAAAWGDPQPGGTARFADALTYKLIKVEMVRPFLTPQQAETMRAWPDMMPRVSYLFLTELPERAIEATELNLTSVRLADGMALREEQVRQEELDDRIGQNKGGCGRTGHGMNLKGQGHHNGHIGYGQQALTDVIGGVVAIIEYQAQPGPPDGDEDEGKFQDTLQRQVRAEPVAKLDQNGHVNQVEE